jgi:hypothetical protein
MTMCLLAPRVDNNKVKALTQEVMALPGGERQQLAQEVLTILT